MFKPECAVEGRRGAQKKKVKAELLEAGLGLAVMPVVTVTVQQPADSKLEVTWTLGTGRAQWSR